MGGTNVQVLCRTLPVAMAVNGWAPRGAVPHAGAASSGKPRRRSKPAPHKLKSVRRASAQVKGSGLVFVCGAPRADAVQGGFSPALPVLAMPTISPEALRRLAASRAPHGPPDEEEKGLEGISFPHPSHHDGEQSADDREDVHEVPERASPAEVGLPRRATLPADIAKEARQQVARHRGSSWSASEASHHATHVSKRPPGLDHGATKPRIVPINLDDEIRKCKSVRRGGKERSRDGGGDGGGRAEAGRFGEGDAWQECLRARAHAPMERRWQRLEPSRDQDAEEVPWDLRRGEGSYSVEGKTMLPRLPAANSLEFLV